MRLRILSEDASALGLHLACGQEQEWTEEGCCFSSKAKKALPSKTAPLSLGNLLFTSNSLRTLGQTLSIAEWHAVGQGPSSLCVHEPSTPGLVPHGHHPLRYGTIHTDLKEVHAHPKVLPAAEGDDRE